MTELDTADLKMAQVAINYYIAVWEYHKKPIPPGAYRLREHLPDAIAACLEPEPEPAAPQTEWITTAEAAQRTGQSERTIRRNAPKIGGKQVGRTWLIPAQSLPKYEEEEHVA